MTYTSSKAGSSAKLQRVGLMIKKVSYLTSTSLFMIKN
jgi:hypothetical protein